MNLNEPLLSIVIPTKNSEFFLKKLLPSLRNQSYKNIEMIISDGESTDNTLQIAKKFRAKILHNSLILAEPGVTLGMKHASGDLITLMAVDNIYNDNDALRNIVEVFQNKNVYAAFPKHDSEPNYTLFSKYINTFTEPFSHFIYADVANARTFKRVYRTIEHNKMYDIYDFKSSRIKPLLAFAQGFTIRSSYLKIPRNGMDDIQPVFELINSNKKIAYVHSVSLYHDTIRDLDHFIRKTKWATTNALQKEKYGISERIDTLTRWQKLKVYIFPIYSLSIIFPTLRAIYRAIIDKELLWLFHPYITFISAFTILSETLKIKMNNKKAVSRL